MFYIHLLFCHISPFFNGVSFSWTIVSVFIWTSLFVSKSSLVSSESMFQRLILLRAFSEHGFLPVLWVGGWFWDGDCLPPSLARSFVVSCTQPPGPQPTAGSYRSILMFRSKVRVSRIRSGNSRQAGSAPGWEARFPQKHQSTIQLLVILFSFLSGAAAFGFKQWPGSQSLISFRAFLAPLAGGSRALAATACFWLTARQLLQPHSVFHSCSTEMLSCFWIHVCIFKISFYTLSWLYTLNRGSALKCNTCFCIFSRRNVCVCFNMKFYFQD